MVLSSVHTFCVRACTCINFTCSSLDDLDRCISLLRNTNQNIDMIQRNTRVLLNHINVLSLCHGKELACCMINPLIIYISTNYNMRQKYFWASPNLILNIFLQPVTSLVCALIAVIHHSKPGTFVYRRFNTADEDDALQHRGRDKTVAIFRRHSLMHFLTFRWNFPKQKI